MDTSPLEIEVCDALEPLVTDGRVYRPRAPADILPEPPYVVVTTSAYGNPNQFSALLDLDVDVYGADTATGTGAGVVESLCGSIDVELRNRMLVSDGNTTGLRQTRALVVPADDARTYHKKLTYSAVWASAAVAFNLDPNPLSDVATFYLSGNGTIVPQGEGVSGAPSIGSGDLLNWSLATATRQLADGNTPLIPIPDSQEFDAEGYAVEALLEDADVDGTLTLRVWVDSDYKVPFTSAIPAARLYSVGILLVARRYVDGSVYLLVGLDSEPVALRYYLK